MSKASILIVEDERIVVLDIQNSLEKNGFSVAGHADRGEDAINKAGELRPGLILMDIGLKGEIDGIEAATQIRALFDLPVIFLTAFTTQPTLKRARLAEPFGYIVKPFDERELVSNIEMALYKHGLEKRLRESENKFRSVIEHASDGVALIDSQGNVTEWNLAMEQFTGIRHSEVLHMPVWDVVFRSMPHDKKTAEMREVIATQWKTEIKNGYINKDRIAEYEIESINGVRRFVQSNRFTVETAQGRMGGVIMRDVTERKQAEAAIRESEKRFRLLFDTATDGIIFTKPNDTVHSANPAACAILGYSETELQGLNRNLLLDFSDPRISFVMEERDRLGSSRGEFTAIRKGGSRFPAEVTSVLFPQEDLKSSMFFRDITERKAAEAERERLVAELKNKNIELERFSYAVSHDLKAPLFTIQGFMGYLEQDILANNPEKIKNDLHRINGAIDKMQRLLNELLELSRVGRIINAPQEIPFGVIATDAVNLVAGRIADKHVAVDIAPDLPVVFCDRTRIVQVVQNLVDNAVKFMGGQPVPQIWIGQRTENGELVLYVRDNGMGIPPEFQERIFGLFDKLDSNIEGTGLGLALVKRIIETHGGHIWAESEGSGKGTTFCFTLPMKSM